MKERRTKEEIVREVEQSRADTRLAWWSLQRAVTEQNPVVRGWRAAKIIASQFRRQPAEKIARADRIVRKNPYRSLGLAAAAGFLTAVIRRIFQRTRV